jgi:hypothetical protein
LISGEIDLLRLKVLLRGTVAQLRLTGGVNGPRKIIEIRAGGRLLRRKFARQVVRKRMFTSARRERRTHQSARPLLGGVSVVSVVGRAESFVCSRSRAFAHLSREHARDERASIFRSERERRKQLEIARCG